MERTILSEAQRFKGKISLDVKKMILEKKSDVKIYYAEIYDKKTVYEFPSYDLINWKKHFWIDKKFIATKNLSTAGISVYCVLCSRADFVKSTYYHVSIENICIMAGISDKTAKKGIDNLVSIGLLKIKKVSISKRTFNTYLVEFGRKPKLAPSQGTHFLFNVSMIETRCWANLIPRAKALYISLRSVAYFDAPTYFAEYDQDRMEFTGDEFRERAYDYTNMSLKKLCSMANISRTNIQEVLENLKKWELIEIVGSEIFVKLTPSQ